MDAAGNTWILGYSQSHNGAVCLLKEDAVVVAVQEERLTRVKRQFLSNIEESLAFQYVLSTAGIRFRDLDMIVCCSFNTDLGELPALRNIRGVPHHTISHHLGHALGVFDSSGFDDATVLIVDGQGGPVLGLPEPERRHLVPSTMEGPGNDDQSEIVSIYEPGNRPSGRVMDRLGFGPGSATTEPKRLSSSTRRSMRSGENTINPAVPRKSC